MSEASHWWERRPEAAGALGALGMGLLFGTGFDPLGWQWMSLIALVGFFLVFAARPTPARAALVGFLFGLGWFVPGLSWTMNSIAVYGRLPWAVAALALFVLGAVLSLFPAFACWIAKKIGGGRLATELPALAGVWTLAEWLRGDALANFGWLMPGYAVIDTPLAGWAPLGGIYAVTLAQLLFAAPVAVALPSSIPVPTTPERLAAAYSWLKVIRMWCDAVEGAMYDRLNAHGETEGYKLVAGRPGPRKWTDAEAAEAELRKALKVDQAYDRKVISPTTAEKLHKAGEIGPKYWARLSNLIGRSDGKPLIVPSTDERPALTPQLENDFDDLDPKAEQAN